MNLNRNTFAICFTAIVLAMGLAFHGYATRPMPTEPAVVAIVNVQELFDKARLRLDAEKQIAREMEPFRVKMEDMQAEIEGLQDDVQLFATGSDERTKAEALLLEKSFEYRGYVEIAKQVEAMHQAEALRGIYSKIRTGAKEVAEANNIDLVFVDDSTGELNGMNQEQMNAQIGARRLLYATRELDITDELIVLLNNR